MYISDAIPTTQCWDRRHRGRLDSPRGADYGPAKHRPQLQERRSETAVKHDLLQPAFSLSSAAALSTRLGLRNLTIFSVR